MEQAARDWNTGQRFGAVHGSPSPRLTAPEATGLHCAGQFVNAPRLLEDDRPAAVQKYALLGCVAHRRRQRAPFGVPAGRDQHVGRVAVVDALDDLLDDRTLVEIVST